MYDHTKVFPWRTLNYYVVYIFMIRSCRDLLRVYPQCLSIVWFLLTKISYKVKRHTYKIYQKWNKSVAHQTNTCNTRLLHVNLGVISLLHHAKIYYAVDYYENTTTSNTSCNTSRKVLPTSRNSKIPKIFMQSFKQSPAYLVGSTTMKYYL